MLHDDMNVTEISLQRTRKICKVCAVVSVVVCIIVLVWRIVGIFSLAFSIFGSSYECSISLATSSLVILSLSGLITAAFLAVLSKMFSRVAKGTTPFSMEQVKRLRILAVLLVIFFVVEIATSFVSMQLQQIGVDTGFFITGAEVNSFITVDFSSLLFSAVFLALSFVFKYGVLLQSLSDDTV